MALTDAYATVPQYRALKDSSASDDGDSLLWRLKAMSRFIDQRTNNPYGFNKDATVTSRVYRVGQEIVPIASTVGLVIKASTARPVVWADETALTEDEDYELEPTNPITGWPYTTIRLLGWSSSPPSVWTPQTYLPDDYRMQVTAIHGWPAVPDAIRWATIELTAMLSGESVFTTGQISELDGVVNTSPQARALLRDLSSQFNPYPVGIG